MAQVEADTAERQPAGQGAILEPLRLPLFRRIWIAGLLSNFGTLIGSVGGAWAMTQLTSSADMVALVQTAISAPVLLVGVWAGAMADMYDRRKLAIGALMLSVVSAAALTVLAYLGHITPGSLLALMFLIGCGSAMYGPAWQASVSEQVPSHSLPSAIALNSISFNIARSFGPAIGGIIVAVSGASASFAVNVLCYAPLILALWLWKRVQEPGRLPPEHLVGAVVAGLRYVRHSPPIRTILLRTVTVAAIGGSALALMPLIARDRLGGDATTYGLLLGAFGLGAVLGALNLNRLRASLNGERGVRICALLIGVGLTVAGASHVLALTIAALMVAGFGWLLSMTSFNVAVQLSSPRWVAARSVSVFQGMVSGGIALGAWGWGHVAENIGVGEAMIVSGVAMLGTVVMGLLMPIPAVEGVMAEAANPLDDPEVALQLTHRSGPVVIEVEYRVPPHNARDFYQAMAEVRALRHRNGAFNWTLARDVGDPELWIERYNFPTWLDFLRHRNRPTRAEREVQDKARAFHIGGQPIRIRRMLERPFGSVRWREESPDRDPPIEPIGER